METCILVKEYRSVFFRDKLNLCDCNNSAFIIFVMSFTLLRKKNIYIYIFNGDSGSLLYDSYK